MTVSLVQDTYQYAIHYTAVFLSSPVIFSHLFARRPPALPSLLSLAYVRYQMIIDPQVESQDG